MIVIKRYPNRKLYNTNAKKYVTLQGIAQLIRTGNDVEILDHVTGEDLTSITLTQIIFEQEKKQGGFLPHSVLTGLIKSGGQTLESMRRTMASPLKLSSQVDFEIHNRLARLKSQGELTDDEASILTEKLLSVSSREFGDAFSIEDTLEKLLTGLGIPTQDDIQRLDHQVDVLVSRIENMT